MIGIFAPFMIILVILLLGIFLSKKMTPKLLRGNNTTLLFKGYVLLLVIASFSSSLLPSNDSFAGKAVSNEVIEQQKNYEKDIFPLVESGRIGEVRGAEVREKWTFPLEGKMLSISPMYSEAYIQVFVEHVAELKGQVEAYHYSSRTYMEGVDITERIHPPRLEIEGESLNIYSPASTKVKFFKMGALFPFNQFSGDGNIYFDDEAVTFGVNFLYLRVPEGTKVTGDVTVVR